MAAILSLESQRRVLEAIPEPRRGIFLALALLGLRASEARVLKASDYREGWISVRKSKNKKGRRLPAPEILADWIDKYCGSEARMRNGPLFRVPYSGRGRRPAGEWSETQLRVTWYKACEAACVPRVPLYEGTKHTFATHLTAEEPVVQAILGHQDAKSTRRYRQLKQQAVLEALGHPTGD